MFAIFINDVVEHVTSTLLKFADDTKTTKKVASIEEAFTLTGDLHRMFDWSEDWQMLFNIEKCKCLHLRSKNPNYGYFMGLRRKRSQGHYPSISQS